MCRKGTSSLGWMQPQWWQQICVWHWAYALPTRYMLWLFFLSSPGKSIITFKTFYFQRSGPRGPLVFTPSTVVCCRKSKWMFSHLWGRSVPWALSFTFSMATELIPKPYCGKISLEFNRSFAWIIFVEMALCPQSFALNLTVFLKPSLGPPAAPWHPSAELRGAPLWLRACHGHNHPCKWSQRWVCSS